MAKSQLRELLEKGASWEDFSYIIPHPLLPPRYRKIAENRNMILLFDRDLTLHVRWEGSQTYEHHPLTPRAAIHLLHEVSTNMVKYRRELQIFSRFIDSLGEAPFEDPRYELPSQDVSASVAKKPRQRIREVETVASLVSSFTLPQLPQPTSCSMGGESPIGRGFDDW